MKDFYVGETVYYCDDSGIVSGVVESEYEGYYRISGETVRYLRVHATAAEAIAQEVRNNEYCREKSAWRLQYAQNEVSRETATLAAWDEAVVKWREIQDREGRS